MQHTLRRTRTALVFALALIASVFVTANRPADAAEACVATRNGTSVELTWVDEGHRHVIRRDGKWLVTLPRPSSSYIDLDAPDGATYLVRTRTAGVITDLPCLPGTPVTTTTTSTSTTSTTSTTTTTIPLPPAIADRVVHISVDGLRSDVVTAEHMPVLTELLARSSSTLEARSDVTVTKTLPNHLSQFTGRPAATAEGHGVTFNQDNGGTVHEFSDSDYVASIFDVVHDRGDRTVAFVGKSKFYLIERSWNAEHGAPDEVGDDDGPAKIDYFKKGAPNWLDDDLLDELEIPGTRYAFFHIRTPDKGGHDFGWGSPEYLDAVTDADALLGEILDRVSQSPLVADGTIFVVTSDHGGPTGGDVHSDASNPENYVIPFVVHDPDWTESFDLYDLNPERLRPLADANPPEAIRTLDVANLVTGLLGHPPVNPDGPQMLQVR